MDQPIILIVRNMVNSDSRLPPCTVEDSCLTNDPHHAGGACDSDLINDAAAASRAPRVAAVILEEIGNLGYAGAQTA